MKNTLVVNFYAGPGTGKSTMMAHTFAELKWRGIDCEMATEYAKDKVWERSEHILQNQFYVSGQQYHRLRRLNGKVDVIVTDSPLLLGVYYGRDEPQEFQDLLVTHYHTFNNCNIFLGRVKEYKTNGRMQTEDQAKQIDTEIKGILAQNEVSFSVIPATKDHVQEVVDLILARIKSFPTI